MSAVVCGKRSLFDEIHSSPPIPKRVRCGSGGSSPIHLLSWKSGALLGTSETLSPAQSSVDFLNLLSQLQALFPDMDGELLENALESSGNNLDSAIKSLNELCLTSDQRNSLNHIAEGNASINCQPGSSLEGETPAAPAEVGENPDPKATLLFDNSEWVDLFVQEMLSASNLDDARDRAARALQAFEKTVMATAGSMFEEMQKENGLLKEQLGALLRDNQILKRAVTIQHERQVEHENCAKEIQELKQMITQYQEQIRNLELSNYALNLHLRKAQEGTSMPGRFHPDVF